MPIIFASMHAHTGRQTSRETDRHRQSSRDRFEQKHRQCRSKTVEQREGRAERGSSRDKVYRRQGRANTETESSKDRGRVEQRQIQNLSET